MKLLGIKLDQIGDFAVALPALHAAHEAGAQIHLVVSPWNLGWKEVLPWVEKWQVTPLRINQRHRQTLLERFHGLKSLLTLSYVLPQEHYDVAIDLRMDDGNWHGKFIAFLSQAPVRLGGLGLGSGFLTRPLPATKIHQEERTWERVNAAVPLPTSIFTPITSVKRSPSSNGPPRIHLYPGTTALSKSWPETYWSKLVQLLTQKLPSGAQIEIVGSAKDRFLLENIAAGSGEAGVRTSYPQSIREFLESIAESNLVVSLDSASQHLARLVNTPTVTLFAGTALPQRWAAKGNNVVLIEPVPCAPCYSAVCRQTSHICMEKITPEQVLQVIMRQLNNTRSDALLL